MRAATTKIPHLLYEKDLLKTPKVMYDFIYNLTFIYNESIWWGWEKKPKHEKYETKEKDFPRLVALPVYEMEADCFPVSENTENKPDPPTVLNSVFL